MKFFGDFWVSATFICALLCLTVVLAGERAAKCSLSVDEGNCSEQILRWFFNSKTGHCETFVYSGCGGNANNFNSTMYCLHACNGTASNTHSYSISGNSDENSKKDDKNSAEPKKTKRSRDSRFRSKRSDDVTRRGSESRALPGNGAGGQRVESGPAADGGLRSILAQLAQSVRRLETIVRDNSRKISKISKRNSNRRIASSVSSANFRVNKKSETSIDSPAGRVDQIVVTTPAKRLEDSREIRSLNDDDEGRKTSKNLESSVEHDQFDLDEDEKERNLLEFKIKSLINDPSYVFSCRNITQLDMSALKEAVSEFDTEALQEISSASSSSAHEKIEKGNSQNSLKHSAANFIPAYPKKEDEKPVAMA